MKKIMAWVAVLLPILSFSQEPAPQTGALRITWPINRSNFQQNASNQADVNIAGQFIGSELYPTFFKVRKLQYKIVKLNTMDGSLIGDYTNGYLDFNDSDINNKIPSNDFRTYLKELTLPNGWYQLQVRIRKGLLSGFESIQRQDVIFGVGDNYLIAGQSNAAGYFDGNDAGVIQNAQNYTTFQAVSVIDRKDLGNDANSIKIEGFPINTITRDNNNNPIAASQKGFSKLEKTRNGNYSYIYPRGQGSWCWGPLGSKLVENQANVPILLFNSAQRNSEIKYWSDKYWRDEAGNYMLPPSWAGDPCITLPCLNKATYWPYLQFRSALQMYGHILGLRSILWHQGENDAQREGNNSISNFNYYTGRMNDVINQSRTDIGNTALSWLSSQVSYYVLNGVPVNTHAEANPTNLNIAQQAVWNSGNYKFPGIFTDDLGSSYRNSVLKIHFTGETHKIVGDRWFAKNPAQAPPTPGKTLLGMSVVLNNTTSTYRLTAIPPSGVVVSKYFWVANEDGIYSPLNTDLNQNYYDVPVTLAGTPKFITCYAGVSTGEASNPIGNATEGWNLKLYATQPFIIPGYENAVASLVPSKKRLAYPTVGGNNTFTVSVTNLNWEALENIPWLSFMADEDLNGGEGNYPITVVVQPNTALAARTATVTVQQEGGGYAEIIDIYQEGTDDCSPNLNLISPTNDISTPSTKKASATIQASNKITGNVNAVYYKAGNSILLNPGFRADNGVVFKAQIEGCTVNIPWQATTIGSVSGTITGNLTIDGTGDVSGTADNFQFYNKSFSGDVTVIARIINITAIDGMRGGIMLRTNTSQGSKMYEFILDGNGNVGKLKRRNPSDVVEFKGFTAMPTSNTWLKMTKTGNTIKCFAGTDGSNWNEVVGWDDQTDNDLGSDFLVGFVGYNSNNAQNCVVNFDNMSVNSIPVN